ncbi:hypothetical protein [Halobacterium wangiae]|uniref:hypothetical protein n=1 Tax=Halobacterium wangiae TaxID=2902623 RepID=UPI001E602B42|nr:hypothetical protein [Halobacterium wangiae]
MATTSQSVRVVADLTMHVPRNDSGDLDSGAEGVVARIAAVRSVEAVDVTNLRPRLNDLQVDATVTVTLDVEDAPGVETAGQSVLADGFGVETVENVRRERAGADPPVPEVG